MSRAAELVGAGHDPDMRLSPLVLHFFPVVLAIFILTMSVAGHSVFFGFEEDEPITWMSLSLMLAVLVILVAVIRAPDLEPVKRWAAIVLSAVAAFALLDERLRWHEAFGRWVKNDLDLFNRDVRHYTDDVVVVAFALAGTLLCYLFIRKLENPRQYVPYVACAAGLALVHGLLDILGHGGRLWRLVIPEITGDQVDLLTDYLSVYEEACKLWAEWFVLLFVLRFFHRQRGPLAWSMLVMIGSFLAGIGLWAIEDAEAGVPYLVMERTLRYLRNYHLLFALAAIFVVWSVVAWRLAADRPARQGLAGLFFLTPFYALLPAIASAMKGVLTTLGVAGTVLVGIGLVAAAASPRLRGDSRVRLAAVAVAVGLGLVGLSVDGLLSQPLRLLAIGGVLFPWAVFMAARQRASAWKPMVATALPVAAAALFQNPLWLLVAFGIALAVAIRRLEASIPRRAWGLGLAAQAVAIAVVFYLLASPILPEYRFRVRKNVVFATGMQEIDLDYYRSNE